MAALDTNVLVRWLTRDDEGQFTVADRVFDEARTFGAPLWVPVTVLLELEWVLRSRYRVSRADFGRSLDALLGLPELRFDAEAAVERALWRFKRPPHADFADCLHTSLAEQAGQAPLLSFDLGAAAMQGVKVL